MKLEIPDVTMGYLGELLVSNLDHELPYFLDDLERYADGKIKDDPRSNRAWRNANVLADWFVGAGCDQNGKVALGQRQIHRMIVDKEAR